MSGWRQGRAIGLLPGVGTVAIPALIVLLAGTNVGWELDGAWQALPVAAGALLIGVGLALMWRTMMLFVREGEGTLAPWDPTQRLIVAGPYRYVRNPMITGVLTILLGEASLLGSLWLLAWAALFFAVNAVYFPLVEEPALERRFGAVYAEYRRHVPRWLPSRSPWMQPR